MPGSSPGRGARATWAAIVTVPGCVASVLAYVELNSLHADHNRVVNVAVLATPFPLIAAILTAGRIVAAVPLAGPVWVGVQLPGAARPSPPSDAPSSAAERKEGGFATNYP